MRERERERERERWFNQNSSLNVHLHLTRIILIFMHDTSKIDITLCSYKMDWKETHNMKATNNKQTEWPLT